MKSGKNNPAKLNAELKYPGVRNSAQSHRDDSCNGKKMMVKAIDSVHETGGKTIILDEPG